MEGGGGSVLPGSRWLDSLRREVGSQSVPETQPPLQRCHSMLAWKGEKWADSFQRTPIIPGLHILVFSFQALAEPQCIQTGARLAPCLQPPAGTQGSAFDLHHILKNQHLAGEERSLTAVLYDVTKGRVPELGGGRGRG